VALAFEDDVDDQAVARALFLQLVKNGPALSLEDLLGRPSWQRDGACVGIDLAVFFPGRGQSAAPAKAVCARCGVLEECRAWALAQGSELVGIWGGLSERQRRQIGPAADQQARVSRLQVLPEHGTLGRYGRHGCRCDLCRAAKSAEHQRTYDRDQSTRVRKAGGPACAVCSETAGPLRRAGSREVRLDAACFEAWADADMPVEDDFGPWAAGRRRELGVAVSA
jgi:hypothetical protein